MPDSDCLSLDDYARRVTEIVEKNSDPAAVVDAIAPLKEQLLRSADLCPDRFFEGLEDVPYTRNLLYADPEGRFTVIALVWGAEKGSPAHDHETWGVVGVLKEKISVVNYDQAAPGAGLAERDRECFSAGSVIPIKPPRESNIHCMRNDGKTACLTIHTYGDPAMLCRIYDPKSGSTRDCQLTFHNAR